MPNGSGKGGMVGGTRLEFRVRWLDASTSARRSRIFPNRATADRFADRLGAGCDARVDRRSVGAWRELPS